MLRPLTSQDFRCGSNVPEKPSFLEAENDLVRRSSGKNEVVGGRLLLLLLLRWEVEERKIALRAAAAVEEVGGLRVEDEEEALLFGSRPARRSQRHEGQKPVKFSCGCWGQEVEGRLG